jgi:hypothetical protein
MSWDARESEAIATLMGAIAALNEKCDRQAATIAAQESWLRDLRGEVFDLKTKAGEGEAVDQP